MKKKYKYVVEVGCSYTAIGGNLVKSGETYGDIVANHFGAKCYNLAMSGGSFQRMGRKVYQWCAKNKDKFNDTLILLGMTSLDRYEIWNNNSSSWQPITGHHWDSAVTMDAHWEYVIPWTVSDKKKYFINFYNDKAQFLSYMNTIIGLQSFFKVNNIDNIFFNAFCGTLSSLHDPKSVTKGYSIVIDELPFTSKKKVEPQVDFKLLWDNLVSKENWYTHPKYKAMSELSEIPDMRISKEDEHPNKKAHKYWGECLLEYINEKNI
jgi:hypothetical protein|tara:strand:- start:855 stop:1646 length:792 start_codon:yes stop_codon:yes gene_type:complete